MRSARCTVGNSGLDVWPSHLCEPAVPLLGITSHVSIDVPLSAIWTARVQPEWRDTARQAASPGVRKVPFASAGRCAVCNPRSIRSVVFSGCGPWPVWLMPSPRGSRRCGLELTHALPLARWRSAAVREHAQCVMQTCCFAAASWRSTQVVGCRRREYPDHFLRKAKRERCDRGSCCQFDDRPERPAQSQCSLIATFPAVRDNRAQPAMPVWGMAHS